MTPATARSVLLHLILAWLGVLAAWLALHGVRDLAGTGPDRRRRPLRGAARVLGGAAGLAALGWLVT